MFEQITRFISFRGALFIFAACFIILASRQHDEIEFGQIRVRWAMKSFYSACSRVSKLKAYGVDTVASLYENILFHVTGSRTLAGVVTGK